MKMMPQALIYRIIGNPPEEAQRLCDEGEIELRILKEGDTLAIGKDYRIDRLNVTVIEGKVTRAVVG